jgi:hypothetical protein
MVDWKKINKRLDEARKGPLTESRVGAVRALVKRHGVTLHKIMKQGGTDSELEPTIPAFVMIKGMTKGKDKEKLKDLANDLVRNFPEFKTSFRRPNFGTGSEVGLIDEISQITLIPKDAKPKEFNLA